MQTITVDLAQFKQMHGRIKELECALRSLIDMETDRYACASERNAQFAKARRVLEKTV